MINRVYNDKERKNKKEDVPLVAEYNVYARRQPTVIVPSSEDLFSFVSLHPGIFPSFASSLQI